MFRSFLSLVILASLMAVPSPAAAQTKPGPRNTTKSAVTTTVNINTANAAEFDALPGIGAKTAALIVEYRQKNGRIADLSTSPPNPPTTYDAIAIEPPFSFSRALILIPRPAAWPPAFGVKRRTPPRTTH
jgi:Helix-hairpin-helix motif